MVLNKEHITDYMRCPYLFGRLVVSNKYGVLSKLHPDAVKFRNHVSEVASYEMKNGCKLDLAEYRVRYTNKYHTTINKVIGNPEAFDPLIPRLNNLLSVFSDAPFLSYNMPIDIPVPGTSVIYRDVIDFIMIDENKDVTIVEIDDLSDIELYKRMMKHWVHYAIPYSYLSNSFEKKINVVILDPVENSRLDIAFIPERWNDDLRQLTEVVKPIYANNIYKNLFACSSCELVGECK